MICVAPVVLAGYLVTLYPNQSHVTTVNAPTFEVQTCGTGIGLHATVATSGLYGLGLHYGWTQTWGAWSLTAQPKAGLSYADPTVYELPQRKQFEVGLQILGGYDRLRVGMAWWHLSNAGLMQPNIGLDMLIVQVGVQFPGWAW